MPSSVHFWRRDKYKVEDPEILSAITWHTTGKEDMTLLEKIIYIADYIEPARNKGTAPYPPSEAGIHRYRRMHV